MAGGKLIVISAPSGAGKTTIAREILRRNPSLEFSVSATTRAKRAGEVDGRDYVFMTPAEFQAAVGRNAFVEWEEIFGQRYGTLRSSVEKALREGRHVLFDVDVNGALAIKRAYPSALLIFIRPPSVESLEQRLRKRDTEDPSSLATRLARVPMEMERGTLFDVQVVNEDLKTATDEVQDIVEEFLTTVKQGENT